MNTAQSPHAAAPLARIADTLTHAYSLEELVRPLLELLESITGMESTYLTTVDDVANLQTILFARNTREMQIPEALSVPWGDTLCRRSLEEGRAFTDDVPAIWGDSDAAAALGIRSYVSVPVRIEDGHLYGTLCAASARQAVVSDEAIDTLRLFSSLISQQVERERLLVQLQAANAALARNLLIDTVTGLPNRQALMQELSRRTARANRLSETLLVAFIDLDDFKTINDRHGHEVGDQFLSAVGRALSGALRADDFVARLGGDEFVALGSFASDKSACAIPAFRARLLAAASGRVSLGDLEIDYAGPSIGVIAASPGMDHEAMLASADAAMYADKRERKLSKPAESR